jgi:hypothetical protein
MCEHLLWKKLGEFRECVLCIILASVFMRGFIFCVMSQGSEVFGLYEYGTFLGWSFGLVTRKSF